MKFIIAGYGFVGKAVHNAFKKKHDVVIVDPKYTTNEIKYHHDADGLIICVPTPTTEDGICDASIIANILDEVPIFMPVLIKSTVTPAIATGLAEVYPNHSIVFGPEFLRANTAEQDFLNQKYVVLGGEDPDALWHSTFLETLPNCKLVLNCSAEEACLVKYATNSFLALKSSFFNQLFDVCANTNMDFDIVRQILSQDTRIGNGHTLVPGPDGERGWGGHCFPKDTEAFVQWTTTIGAPVTLVESAIQYNNKVRKNT
jgi:UDPglucose 6-dehydrogenase